MTTVKDQMATKKPERHSVKLRGRCFVEIRILSILRDRSNCYDIANQVRIINGFKDFMQIGAFPEVVLSAEIY